MGLRFEATKGMTKKERDDYHNDVKIERLKLYIHHRGDECELCACTYPREVYHLHHVNPANKAANLKVSLWTGKAGIPGGKIWIEANKCALLCANCHALEHKAMEAGSTLFPSGYCTPDGSTTATKPQEETP